MISQEQRTFLLIYDRCIRCGEITDEDLAEGFELAREIALTQTVNGEFIDEMLRRMAGRLREAEREDEETTGD